MLKREYYIKHVTNSLSWFRLELEANNAVGLFDGNHMAEDFICGLLNLVYGYNLKNENHRQKNAVAVDLTDSKNRLAVQVTSQNTREKIQKTINSFIAHKLYQEYDQLFIFLLKGRKIRQKPFQTREYFSFSNEQHIIDIYELTQKISTLDIEKLKEINSYLNAELEDVHWNEKRRFLRPSFIIPFLVLVMVLIFTLVVCLWNIPFSGMPRSTLLPYAEAGCYESSEEISLIQQTEIKTTKAFSLLSFVRCYSFSPSRIENISCRILELEPIEEPDLILDACIVNQTLKLFAFNNGWGTAEAPSVQVGNLNWNGSVESLTQISDSVRFSKKTDIAPASAVLLAEYDMDYEKFQKLQSFYGYFGQPVPFTIEVCGENCFAKFDAELGFENGRFILYSRWSGDCEPSKITLFSILNVDDAPSTPFMLTFTGENSTPRVNNDLCIETMLAPTKSCFVKFQNVFLIDGKNRETDVYTATVTVPAFDKAFNQPSNLITQELAELDHLHEASINETIQKYLYNPSNIQPQSRTTSNLWESPAKS